MCAPLAAPMIGLIGAGVSAMGQMSAANAQAQNSLYNAQVERVNEGSRRIEGHHAREDIAADYRRLTGQQQAATAKGGMDPFYGSANDIFTETDSEMRRALDTNYIESESKATAHSNKQAQYRMMAKDQEKAGKIGAASTFLGGMSGLVKAGFGQSLGSSGGGSAQAHHVLPA